MEKKYYKYKIENLLMVSRIITIYDFELDKNFNHPVEAHDFWEMVYVDKGSVLVTREKEELILSQKWLSLIWNGFEAYNEWRRNEYPIIHIADGTVINNYEMPTRFAYPLTVRTSNSVNMHEALERMGGDNNMHTALWWSYKALNNGSRPEHVRNN